MLCRLFGRPNINKFSLEWLPLLDAATNATIMDWAQILSDNLASVILGYRTKRSFTSRVYPPFFLSAYVMDDICFVSDFPIMGWKWNVQNPLPIQVYQKYYGNPISSHISTRFVMELCSLFIKCSTTETPQDFPQKLKLTFSRWEGGLERSCSHTSRCLATLLHPMCFLFMFSITNGQGNSLPDLWCWGNEQSTERF